MNTSFAITIFYTFNTIENNIREKYFKFQRPLISTVGMIVETILTN